MNLLELERQLGTMFKGAGFTQPGFEARQLLLAALNVEMADLLNAEKQTVAPQLVSKIQHWVKQRIHGVPLAYLAGRKGFYKHDFVVRPGVLVPRPESEHIIEVALSIMGERSITRLADLGCGTGCLGLSLLYEWPRAELYAVDASTEACANSRENIAGMKLEGRAQVIESRVEDWAPSVVFDLVVANPPYIAVGDPQVEANVHDHEPHAALYSGADGLEAIRAWSAWAFRALAIGAPLVFEFGAGQSQAVRDIIKAAGFARIQVQKDLAGIDRVVSGFKVG